MPSVILLDNSLAMCKYINQRSSTNQPSSTSSSDDTNLSKRDISLFFIRKLIENVAKNFQHEHFALVNNLGFLLIFMSIPLKLSFCPKVAYSSTAEVLCEFTKDHARLLDSLSTLKIGSSSCIEEGLNKVSELVIEEWAGFTNVQIILITSDVENSRTNSTKYLCDRLRENNRILKQLYLLNGVDFDEKIHINSILNEDLLTSNREFNLKESFFSCQYPFSFPNRFDIICLGSDPKIDSTGSSSSSSSYTRLEFENDNFKSSKKSTVNKNPRQSYLANLLELNNSTGRLFLTQSLDKDYIEKKFLSTVFDELYKKSIFELKCGNLQSFVSLIPNPTAYKG
jgi:hypothetical protein